MKLLCALAFMATFRCVEVSKPVVWWQKIKEPFQVLNEDWVSVTGLCERLVYSINVLNILWAQDLWNTITGEDTSKHPPFQCPDMSPSTSVPKSVERVKPADIKVIAALGDSMTTATAANASNLDVIIDYRHLSWSIGGHGTYQDVITLANIVKLFNPSVVGPSPNFTVYGQPVTLKDTGFNFAVNGHNTLNLTEQTRNMIDAFKTHPAVNFEVDWKLVTVWIGVNDICDYCKNKNLFSVDNYIHHITQNLQMMMDEVPRLIVNMVQLMDFTMFRDVKKPTPECHYQKLYCPCLVLPAENSAELKEVSKINRQFKVRLEKLLHSRQFFKKDFAVVLQPFLSDLQLPTFPNGTADLSYFAPDCFHAVVKTHEEFAKGLWNNMFQPVGKKKRVRNLTKPLALICPPKDHPYIYTRPKRTT